MQHEVLNQLCKNVTLGLRKVKGFYHTPQVGLIIINKVVKWFIPAVKTFEVCVAKDYAANPLHTTTTCKLNPYQHKG